MRITHQEMARHHQAVSSVIPGAADHRNATIFRVTAEYVGSPGTELEFAL